MWQLLTHIPAKQLTKQAWKKAHKTIKRHQQSELQYKHAMRCNFQLHASV
jgi:hypothetical protein